MTKAEIEKQIEVLNELLKTTNECETLKMENDKLSSHCCMNGWVTLKMYFGRSATLLERKMALENCTHISKAFNVLNGSNTGSSTFKVEELDKIFKS